MKCCFVILAVVFLQYNQLLAQGGRPIRVKAGEDMAQAYSPQGFYRFPQFIKAKIYFSGGAANSGPLFNYNVLSGTMQFISPAGDTLDMVNTNGIDSIVFDKTVFRLKDGAFMEVVSGDDSVKLLKRIVLRTQVENIGAYGLPNSTASITSMKSFTSGTGVYNLVVNQDIVVEETITLFFSNATNIVKASRSNLLKLLPPDKGARADTYLKQNKTSFEKESDLKKLMAAIAG